MKSGVPARDAKDQTEQTARQVATNPWVERLGRLGYAARGVVYLLIGVLAFQAAIGAGGELTDSRGALQTIVEQPFGRFLLAIVALGLFGYALWRLIQAAADTDNKGDDAKGIATRLGYAVSGLIYAALGVSAARLVFGAGQSGGDASQEWTARLLAQPFGRWLVGIVGLIIIGVGLYHIYKGFSTKFQQELWVGGMSAVERTWALRSGQIGLAAHGLVLGLIGVFVLQAALQYDANQARGLGGALQSLLQQPFGPWLLGIVALGLVAYGVYGFVEARYRRMVRA